ncbi:MAG: adenine phosphoribosyltransferase [Vicingus serpentipes]|nr:adenine phosphoribosyltransferase [Vicingus serpentipes]
MINTRLINAIRDVPNFPKPGIIFKDITPILLDPQLTRDVVNEIAENVKDLKLDAVAGIESRGFWFGIMLANQLNVPFIPMRKKGKLPYKTVSYSYDLEYGSAEIEMHQDVIEEGWNVLIHDDLLATGGTAVAAAELLLMQKATVAGFSFVVDLSFLNGKEELLKYSEKIFNLARF